MADFQRLGSGVSESSYFILTNRSRRAVMPRKRCDVDTPYDVKPHKDLECLSFELHFFNTTSQLSLHPSDFWVYAFTLTSEPQSWFCLFVFEAWIIFGSVWSLAASWHSVSRSSSSHCWPRGWHWWIRGKKDAQSWLVRCHITVQNNAQRCWQAGLNQKQMAKQAVASLPVPANFPPVSNVSAD